MLILTFYQAVVNFFAFPKLVILTNITIYGDNPTIRIQFAEITEIYLRLWENDGSTVRIPLEKWMPINILFDVKIKTVKGHFLKPADRKIVNHIFDKLHVQGRMEFTIQPTFHNYPVFVVWRTIRRCCD